jgi:uncharacterized protein
MSSALLLSALLMGLAGGAHCIAMCGAACGGIARACGGERPQRALLVLQMGRLLSYTAAGALVAASVSALGGWSQQVAWLRPLWTMVHLAAVLLGLRLVWAARQPAWLEQWGRRVGAQVAPVQGPGKLGRGLARAGLLGSLWAAWPCGLLQSALLVAALGSSPLSGAAIMATFALASGLSLWVGPSLWWKFTGGRATDRAQAFAVRLAGAMLVMASGWAVVMGGMSLNDGLVCR